MGAIKVRFSWIIAFVVILFCLCSAFLWGADTAGAVSADEWIQGYSPVTAAQLDAVLSLRNPGHIHPGIAQYYVDWGPRFGIRADVAFAQMLHETGSLRYGGVVQPWQNNFAGIGAFDSSHPGYSWPNAEAGVIGHYAHLAWFIYPNDVNAWCNHTWDPGHGSYHRNSVRTIRDLGGQWAVPGTGYGDRLARYANEFYYFNGVGHWLGNFNEVTGMPTLALSTTSIYFPWYDSKPVNGMAGNWILVSNRGSGAATVQIRIGDLILHDPANPANDFFTIPEGGQVTPAFTEVIGGPVKVTSISGQPLAASQRVLFRDSFNEVTGITAESLSDTYEFTWYDSKHENYMAGNWILVANEGSVPADVEIWVGSERKALYSSATGNALAPGAIVTPQFDETMAGPVRVVSTNHQPLIASQRVIFKESFSEVMGYPITGDLPSDYLFTWYDSDRANGMRGDWVLTANMGTGPADVDISIGGNLKARYSAATGNAIPVGGIVTPVFDGVTDGPVRVTSTNGQPLMASQRVIFRDSFEEVQGVPVSALAGEQLFSWYDSQPGNQMVSDWLLAINEGDSETRAEIWIGGSKMHDPDNPANDFFTIPAGGRITPKFTNVIGGPVQIVSLNNQPLMVSQRVLYKYHSISCGAGPCE